MGFEILGGIAQMGEKRREVGGEKRPLLADPAAADGGKAFGIVQLVALQRVRQRHQHRRPADRRELGDCRCPRAGHHQMGGGDAFRQIGEERGELHLDIEPLIVGADGLHVLFPALLDDRQGAAHGMRQVTDHLRHQLGEVPRSLAAAEHQQIERLAGAGRRVGPVAGRQHARPHRVARHGGLGGKRRRQALDLGK